MRSQAFCGHGYGSRAVSLLCALLERQNAVREFVMQPSARNPRAIHAYKKTGFSPVDLSLEDAAARYQTKADYSDSIFMAKRSPIRP